MTDLITTTADLAALCDRLKSAEFVTIDTEFLRDNSYYPKLCLVQLASDDEAAAVDPLAPGIDLAPLYQLACDHPVLKVFHAARQDIEIFFHATGKVPGPVVDTQIAAMVCGFGEQASYETLVNKLANASLDKSSRFTDWAHRPLSERQLAYALDDVTHLRQVYRTLQAKLEDSNRASWMADDLADLLNPETYIVRPEEMWRRLKPRTNSKRFLITLRALAAWRELEAQSRDLPRQRIMKDEVLLQLASHPPTDPDELDKVRSLSKGFGRSNLGQSLLNALKDAANLPNSAFVNSEPQSAPPARGIGPLVDLLKVLLKARAEAEDVAPRLVASGNDLERIASGETRDIPALSGWRYQIFGADALALKRGEVALAAGKDSVKVVKLSGTHE